MRPVERGASPQERDFDDYRKAFGPLMGRLGSYCSFCERRIPTNLAVEHIQPKDDDKYPELEGRWNNYLLACVNCNSTKGHKDVRPENYYLPDRDNTLAAFVYRPDGSIVASPAGGAMATATLTLTGLDKVVREAFDENGNLVAADRITQRMEVWLMARRARELLEQSPSPAVIESVIMLARMAGYFSVWMTVFSDRPAMRRKFIDDLPGSAQSCFDQATTELVTKRPDNGLAGAGKI